MSQAHENLTRDEAKRRVGVVRDPAYGVRLDLTHGDETFVAMTTVAFSSEAGAATFIDCTAVSVDSVTLNGVAVPADAVGETRIQLENLQEHNELVVASTMRYGHEGRGMHHFRDPTDGVAYLHTQFEPFDAHTVFACFDQPDLKGTYAVSVQAPADWVVVSNMALASGPPSGEAGLWEFETTPRLSTYLVAIVAGGYVSVHSRHGDIDLGIYCRRSLRPHLDEDEIFELTRQGLDWFAEAFDLPYPFGKYDQLFVPEFAMGAMEHPGCVTFVESYVFRSKVTDSSRERRAETILHEMAHMWFGDLVTMQWWDDLWLNESFATFMSVLAMAEATRFKESWVTFLDSEKTWAKYQDQLPTTHPIAADAPDVETATQNFDGITYAKGASVLRQLVAWVGQDAFLEGCREYFRQHAWGNATLSDFLRSLEKASGRDLDGWRDEWLMTTGVNTLQASREPGPLAGPITIHQLTGKDHPEPRRHRLEVGLYARDGGAVTRYAEASLDLVGEQVVLESLADAREPELIIVNDADLTYAKVLLDDATMKSMRRDLGAIDDPLARALLWSSAWDMVLDAELPAREFATIVINNVQTETEVGVLLRLLQRAVVAVDRYGDPANVQAGMLSLASAARAAMLKAAPGSDHQLIWMRHWAQTSRSAPGAAEIRAILEGDVLVDGLVLDTDLRWHLVAALAASGAIDEGRVDEELKRDQTDLGERAAAAAKSMLPDARQKQAAWERLSSGDLSHTVARELYKGFRVWHHADLLESFRQPFFALLPRVAESRGMDAAVEWAEGTFPNTIASPQVVADADRALAGDLPGPLRRAILEQRDGMLRTLRARALDAASSN